MRLRSFGFVLAMILTASQMLGVICHLDCDDVAALAACHDPAGSPEGPAVRGGLHACGHDHLVDSPALLVSASGHDSSATLVALPAAPFSHTAVVAAPAAVRETHGPPGLSAGTNASTITILRI